MANKIQKITPFLWYNDNAEEAANFYVSIFDNSKINVVSRYGEAGAKASGRKAGSVMTVDFDLDGQSFTALNGGPHFQFNPAVSLVINCDTQEEIDYFWEQLSAGGRIDQYGWLQDKFGLSWQVVPAALSEWVRDDAKSDKVMAALLPMKKLDLQTLQQAYDKA